MKATEMIGITEFARRMNVCQNTIRYWIRDGILVPGRHYLHCGRIYRFPWSDELLADLMGHLHPEPPPKRPRLDSRSGIRRHRKLKA